jgi:hypothetical protein
MKTLNDYIRESLLDDEEVLINKAIEDSYWADIYKLLKGKKEAEAAKILNDKLKPCKYGEWKKDIAIYRGEQVIKFYKNDAGSSPMRISNVAGKEQLKFSFCDLYGDLAQNDFYEFYGVKYKDFRNKFRENLIKELGLKKASSVSDNWIMEF